MSMPFYSYGIRLIGLIMLMITLNIISIQAQVRPTPVPDNAQYAGRQFVRADRLGITFIHSAQLERNEQRYQNALLLGAGWTRWPLYWDIVQTSSETWDWSAYDQLVIDDMRYGLNINAILLGRPEFFIDGDIITGLSASVFDDGTDTPGQGKQLNPQNPWVNFVYQAVQRYKPGGILARQQGWIAGEGVTVWEIWNEPDLPQFWQGGMRNYARLLKSAYIAAHHADPTVTVMFGGLLFPTQDNWLARILSIFADDPLARRNNWFMDAVAVHSYSYPWRTGWLTLYAKQTLIAYGLDRPIFVNESGISVWNDYPGPTWTSSSEQRLNLSTTEQQAWYFIQSTVYGWSEGASVVFYHQLYDDCGDQAAGTNFPPHNGELCNSDQPCFGDAFGLYRNQSDSICFNQHPNPGTPRPAAAAFRLMATVFGDGAFEYVDDVRRDGLTIFEFQRQTNDERILVIWNRQFEPNTATLLASANSATLYTLEGASIISSQEGFYTIPLSPAQPDNFPNLETFDISAIGGEPIIIVEPVDGDPPPIDTTNDLSVMAQILPTVGPVINPTVSPENDRISPTTYVNPLPEVSPASFTVSWGADDNGEINSYVVWVQIDDGDWIPWLETQRQEAIYTGIPGSTYRFAVWAVDAAGNWSSNITLLPQAETRVE